MFLSLDDIERETLYAGNHKRLCQSGENTAVEKVNLNIKILLKGLTMEESGIAVSTVLNSVVGKTVQVNNRASSEGVHQVVHEARFRARISEQSGSRHT